MDPHISPVLPGPKPVIQDALSPARPFLADAFAADAGIAAGVQSIADYRRRGDPGHVADGAAATNDDVIKTIADFRRLAEATQGGTLDTDTAASLTSHDLALLDVELPLAGDVNEPE
jgi:hypothetical protein